MTPGSVQVLLQRESELPQHDEWLTPEETVVLAGLRFPKRRAEWRLGRWTAKLAVGTFLRIDPAAVRIAASDDGSPQAIVDGRADRVAVSISHRDGTAACAVGPPEAALGCDLETVEPRSEGFVADYLTEAERARVRAAPEDDRVRVVNLMWSAKESALKAVRTGLRADTRSVEVELPAEPEPAGRSDPSGWHTLSVVDGTTGHRFWGWWRDEGTLVLTVVSDGTPDPPTMIR